jgi:molybdate transport system regulatory protein
MAKKNKHLRFRLWIDINGERFFGPGRAELLHLISETGSIARAAKSMGMSYKKAWAMVDEMNSKAYTPYVIAQKGGHKGGGTELTQAGKKIVKAYQRILDRITSILEKEKSFLDLI